MDVTNGNAVVLIRIRKVTNKNGIKSARRMNIFMLISPLMPQLLDPNGITDGITSRRRQGVGNS